MPVSEKLPPMLTWTVLRIKPIISACTLRNCPSEGFYHGSCQRKASISHVKEKLVRDIRGENGGTTRLCPMSNITLNSIIQGLSGYLEYPGGGSDSHFPRRNSLHCSFMSLSFHSILLTLPLLLSESSPGSSVILPKK